MWKLFCFKKKKGISLSLSLKPTFYCNLQLFFFFVIVFLGLMTPLFHKKTVIASSQTSLTPFRFLEIINLFQNRKRKKRKKMQKKAKERERQSYNIFQ